VGDENLICGKKDGRRKRKCVNLELMEYDEVCEVWENEELKKKKIEEYEVKKKKE
jgi:hypothetical protein